MWARNLKVTKCLMSFVHSIAYPSSGVEVRNSVEDHQELAGSNPLARLKGKLKSINLPTFVRRLEFE